MSNVHQLPLWQINQGRGDLNALSQELAVIHAQFALVPALAILTGADLVLAAIELMFRGGQSGPVAISGLSRRSREFRSTFPVMSQQKSATRSVHDRYTRHVAKS